MAAKTKVFKGAGGFIVKHAGEYFKVPKKFIKSSSDSAADVAKRIAKSGDDVTKFPKPKKGLRELYLGATPKKLSRTGQEVAERMAKEGKLVDEFGDAIDPGDLPKPLTRADLNDIHVLDESGTPRPLSEAHMGHKTDAVDYWNDTGYKESPADNRKWMLESDNYEYEYGPDNTAKGRAETRRYTDHDPVGGANVP